MTEELLKSNILFMEYMGYYIEVRPTASTNGFKDGFYLITPDGKNKFLAIDNKTDNHYYQLWCAEAAKANYHLSWDMLMPVVDRIENGGNEINIQGVRCFIKYPGRLTLRADKTKLMATYVACLDHIKCTESKWRNK